MSPAEQNSVLADHEPPASPSATWLAGWLNALHVLVDGQRDAVGDPRGSALDNLATLARWRDAIDRELIPRYSAAARSTGASRCDIAERLEAAADEAPLLEEGR